MAAKERKVRTRRRRATMQKELRRHMRQQLITQAEIDRAVRAHKEAQERMKKREREAEAQRCHCKPPLPERGKCLGCGLPVVLTKRQQAKQTSEASIVDDMLKWLNSLPECYAHKTHGGMFGRAGKPDITGCYEGQRFEVEAKKPGGKVSKAQEKELGRWAAAGCHVAVAYSLEELKAFWRAWGWSDG